MEDKTNDQPTSTNQSSNVQGAALTIHSLVIHSIISFLIRQKERNPHNWRSIFHFPILLELSQQSANRPKVPIIPRSSSPESINYRTLFYIHPSIYIILFVYFYRTHIRLERGCYVSQGGFLGPQQYTE